jgi:hypothetical protein
MTASWPPLPPLRAWLSWRASASSSDCGTSCAEAFFSDSVAGVHSLLLTGLRSSHQSLRLEETSRQFFSQVGRPPLQLASEQLAATGPFFKCPTKPPRPVEVKTQSSHHGVLPMCSSPTEISCSDSVIMRQETTWEATTLIEVLTERMVSHFFIPARQFRQTFTGRAVRSSASICLIRNRCPSERTS